MDQRKINSLNLGKAIGTSHVTILNYRGGQLPKSEHLISLADFFGVSTDAMLGRTEIPEFRCRRCELLEAELNELKGRNRVSANPKISSLEDANFSKPYSASRAAGDRLRRLNKPSTE